ncbi:unnamed protein product [Moneuplotes crassus]|uniref:VTT domain-containing protein n=1 Tax=Euplotes crassus TaxID=5936 RepID=A0AAD2CZ14_EUPCR|nr:unnamed protein product [Moneuplotes crassus]
MNVETSQEKEVSYQRLAGSFTGSRSDPIEMIKSESSGVETRNDQDVRAEDQSESLCMKNFNKILIALGFVAIVTVFSVIAIVYKDSILLASSAYISYMRNHKFYCILIYGAAYIVLTPLCVPLLLIMTFGAYSFTQIYGYWLGFLIFVLLDYFCTIVGSLISFWNSRYLFRNCVQGMIQSKPKLRAFSLALSNNSIKMVALLRISHAMPYHLLNYMCGVTTMSSLNFTLGNLSAILGHVPTIYILSSISDITSGEDPLGPWIFVITAIGVIFMIVIIFKYTKAEIDSTMESVELQNLRDEELAS